MRSALLLDPFETSLPDPAGKRHASWARLELDALVALGVDARGHCLQAEPETTPLGTLRALAAVSPLCLLRAVRSGLGGDKREIDEARALLQWAQRHGVEHLHVHHAPAARTASLCRELGGPSYSIALHGVEGELSSVVSALPGAAFTCCSSHAERERILGHVPPDRWSTVHVLGFGLTTDELDEAPVLPPARPSVTWVGSDARQALDALAALNRAGLAPRMCFVGDARANRTMSEHAQQARLASSVEVLDADAGAASMRHAFDAARVVVVAADCALDARLTAARALVRARLVLTDDAGALGSLTAEGSGPALAAAGTERLVAALRDALCSPDDTLRRIGVRARSYVRTHHDGLQNAASLYNLMQWYAASCHREPFQVDAVASRFPALAAE